MLLLLSSFRSEALLSLQTRYMPLCRTAFSSLSIEPTVSSTLETEPRTHAVPARMTPKEYARGAVNHVLKKIPAPYYWRGTWSGPVKLLDKFFPRSAAVSRFIFVRD